MNYSSKIISFFAVLSIICGLAFLSFNITSCNKTVTEVVYDTTSVHDTTQQNFVSCMLYLWGSEACLFSNPLTDPDSVDARKEWSGDTIIFPIKLTYPDHIELKDNSNNIACTTYTIKVTSNLGNAEGNICIPGSISMTLPSNGDTLPIGDVTVSWTTGQKADFYWVSGYMISYDSLGSGFELTDIDTFLFAVSFVIPSTFFNIDNAKYHYVYLDVYPYSGSLPVPGTSGNMTGTLNGFLNALGNGGSVYFYVGTPIAKVNMYHMKWKKSLDDIRNTYLHALSIR